VVVDCSVFSTVLVAFMHPPAMAAASNTVGASRKAYRANAVNISFTNAHDFMYII
jgi:hypothetical protein